MRLDLPEGGQLEALAYVIDQTNDRTAKLVIEDKLALLQRRAVGVATI